MGPQQDFPGCRLDRADEGAHELAVDLRSDGIDIDALAGEKFAGIFDVIDSRRFDVNLFETGGGRFGAIFVFFQRARDTTNPQQNILADFGQDFAARDHIGDGKTPTGL